MMPLFASVPDTPQVVPLPPRTPDCYYRQTPPAAASACVNEHPSAQVHKEAHESSCMHTQLQHIHTTGMGEHTAQTHQPATPPRKGRKNRAHAEPSALAAVDVAPPSQQQPRKSTRETAAADHTTAKAKRRVREALQHAELLQQRPAPSTPEGTPTRKSSGRATPSMFIPGTPTAVTAAGAAPSLAGGVGKDVLQMPSVLGGISVHSSSHVNLPSPRAPSASRFREFDPSAILGSITPSCVMTNTLSSRPGVNAATERTPLVGFLPSNSRILSSDEGASVASDQYTPVPIHRTLSLLHLESENSCAGRSGSTRTPLPCLLPRPPGSTTASVSTSNTTGSGAAPVTVAVPTSEKEPDASAAATSVATGGNSLAALFPSHADRLCGMAAARRSISSSNGSEWLTILGNSTANSLDVGVLGVPPVCPTSRPGPRGRRSRSGAVAGSPTSVGAAPCNYGSVTAASYGVSMLLDGTLLHSHCRPSLSSSPTASHNTTATTAAMATTTTTNTTTTSGGSYLTDTNTWSTNGSGTSCPSATLAADAGALQSPQRTHPFLAPSATIATGNIVTSDVLPHLPATLPLPSGDSRISNSSGDTFTRNASAFSSGSTASPRRATSGPHTSLSTTAAARTATEFVTLTPSVTTTENASCDDEASVLMADRKTALLLVAAAPPRRSSTELVETSGMDTAACGPAGVAFHMEAQSTLEVAAETRKPSPPAVQEASGSRHRFSESTASNLPVRMITVIPVLPPSGSATTPPLGDHFNTDAPLPQGMPREGSEVEANHPSTVRWLTGTNPSFRGSPVGSMRSSLLPRAGALPGRAGSSANAAPCGRAGSLPGTAQLQLVGEALLPSPRSGSLHSLLPACVPGWSVDDSVDVPLDACDTATVNSMGPQKLDSLCPATESSLSTDASVFAGGSAECPHLTSAFFRQLNSFSRSRMSVTGGIGQRSVGGAGASRHSSIAASKGTSAANSVLTRTGTAAAATTFVSSTTRTTTTTTTRTTSASTAAATAAACATQTSKAATTTVTTTAISSISCSSRQTIVALSAGGGEAAEEAVNGDIRSGLEELPQDTPAPAATQAVDSLLLDDPDAPPFAQAAMRHFREQDSHRGCCAARRTAEMRARDPSSSPRRAWAQSHSSHADGVVSYVVSATAIESSCTAHSFMAEARCLDRSTAHAPPSPQGSMPSQSTALVGRHHTTTEEKATRPLKAEAPCVSGIDVVAVTPLSATEIHLPTLRPAKKRRSLWRVAGGFR